MLRQSDLSLLLPGIKDSKLVSNGTRESLFEPLCLSVFDAGIGHVFPEEIDRIGPASALQLSYTRALMELTFLPSILYVDGKNAVKAWRGNQIIEPKADRTYKQVSAASILAKVYRDRLMREWHLLHPEYGWDSNSGYGTSDHDEAIKKYGLLTSSSDYRHRKSYCKKYIGR